MFEPSAQPRVFGASPGQDFGAQVADHLKGKFSTMAPQEVARVRILSNTERLARRLRASLCDGHPRLLPRLGVITRLQELDPNPSHLQPRSPLARELDLLRLIKPFVDSGKAPPAAAPALAASLAALMEEMAGEGVPPGALEDLDLGEVSHHWAESVEFLRIITEFTTQTGAENAGPEAFRRAIVQDLVASWKDDPPQTPLLIAGSTASRDTTALLMEAVSRLPMGAVYLPGVDFDMPDNDWDLLTDGHGAVDHPQYRIAAFLRRVGLARADIDRIDASDGSGRNPLISLSLRPAPVTDQWLTEGPALGDLRHATAGLTLIEASGQRKEALAISCAIRRAVGAGQTVSVITPDRTLARRVSASLLRWDIVADDSGGRPFGLTAPGRFLRQVADMIGTRPSPPDFIALLSHPLTASGGGERGQTLLFANELDLWLRGKPRRDIHPGDLADFAKDKRVGEKRLNWAIRVLGALHEQPPSGFSECVEHHIRVAEAISSEEEGGGAGELWDKAAGREAFALMQRLLTEGRDGHHASFSDYKTILERICAETSVRSDEAARADVMIWGTLEARVQGADLTILAGLNEGTWPQGPSSDPWLNRQLRRQIGLPLPDREIGLSAHDFQQAASSACVILSRSLREADAESVQSRWLSRLTSLLGGLPDQHGPAALDAMRARGAALLSDADSLDVPRVVLERARRPAPAPPSTARPTDISVTDVEKLVRDPYAIYAKRVLGLKRLEPLAAEATPMLRGNVFHGVMESVLRCGADRSDRDGLIAAFHDAMQRILERDVPWAATRAEWMGHLKAIAPRLAEAEMMRAANARIMATEEKGALTLTRSGVKIVGKVDRIDQAADGTYALYDYKTGEPSKRKVVVHFDRQLPIEAVMIEQGAFTDIPPGAVSDAVYIGLGRNGGEVQISLDEHPDGDLKTVTVLRELEDLLATFSLPTQPYLSRRAPKETRFEGDYDHLSRFGEWDESESADPEPIA